MKPVLLQVENLKTYITTHRGVVRAVDGVSFEIFEEETLGLVGESGCGKSMTALSILKLYPKPQGKIVEGKIVFEGEDLVRKDEEEMLKIRGKRISMIFQEPMTSLDPVFPVGEGIVEVLMLHQGLSRSEAQREAVRLLRMVRIPEPERRVHQYPHQLSGGMRQRVMIAQALACRPKLLIADEPTTALDVTVQAQILELIRTLKKETKTAVLLITHDLGVVAEYCERVAVMYAGKIVEKADVLSLFCPTSPPLYPGTPWGFCLALTGKGLVLRLSRDRCQTSLLRLQGAGFIPVAGNACPVAAKRSPVFGKLRKGTRLHATAYRDTESPKAVSPFWRMVGRAGNG